MNKKILIITANPSSFSFTHKIAEVYKSQAEKKGHEIKTLNLYDKEWQQDYLTFEDIKKLNPEEKQLEIQELIKNSDHFVFIHPVWWVSVPAVMKNFLDINFSARFAFKYTEKGKAIGLLKGKTAEIFMTCGAKGLIALLVKIYLYIWWDKAMLGFCGIKIKKFVLFSGMQDKNEIDKKNLLKKIR